MANIGFIGLGHMGLPMASNLMRAHHHVTVYDISPAARTSWVEAGGKVMMDLPTLAKHNEILITMLQTGDQVRSVCYGDKGLYQHAQPHTLHIDSSTIDVSTAKEIHAQACQHSLLAVDAPVSGGVAGAQAATLTFMLGGDAAACALATPILQTMGKQIIQTGASGSGQAAKTCNNMILGISMLAISESFILAERLGLSPQKLHEVVTHASGQCWIMDHYVPVANILENVPANHAYQPGFSLKMMLKDMHLSQDAAQQCKLQTPIANLATDLFQKAQDSGLGDLDFSAVIKLIG